ncbi:MAG TPA: hypothetical protein PJ988_19065 [Anaerolinea sp.]|nr:hypothetical protein [Anaerolinea sp.]
MSIVPFLLTLWFLGFPLVVILIQWAFIRQRLPWMGMMVSLSIIVFVMVLGFFMTKGPPDCNPFVYCSWDGLGVILIDGYAFLVAILTIAAGFIIKFVYRRRVWKPGEKIQTVGRIPSFLLMAAILGLLACVAAVLKTVSL